MRVFLMVVFLVVMLVFTVVSQEIDNTQFDSKTAFEAPPPIKVYNNVAFGGPYYEGGPGLSVGFGYKISNILFGQLWLLESGHSGDSVIAGISNTAFIFEGSVLAKQFGAPYLDKFLFGFFLGCGGDVFNTSEDDLKTLGYLFLNYGGIANLKLTEKLGAALFVNRKTNPENNMYQTVTTLGLYGTLRF